MDYINLLKVLGFSPKENAVAVWSKTFPQANDYCLEVNLEKQSIDYGEKIQIGRNTCLILDEHHEENSVTLECVNRLLSIGYVPESIKLEQGYPAGHGTTKYLDILVYQDKKPYLMIECKTYGEEFNKELKNTQNGGGQLFTYFQQDTKTELLMLYASKLGDNSIISEYKIIKIEEEFRTAGSVKNVFKYWNKKFYEKDFLENPPYDFQTKKKNTILDLEELTADKGQKLFNQFAEILRRHSVSDKPNAFNVIFNLFLAKIWDEHKAEDEELEFQWDANDDAVDFQVTLYNLHKEGLKEFLKKEMDGIYKENFQAKTPEDLKAAMKKVLKTNSLFAIKNVIDDADFERNHRVLVEVVRMLQGYRIKYPKKQKYLSEFFERLLTVGLKQEVGQYFTPPPITKFIVRALPLPEMIKQATKDKVAKLPAVIDYAAGSGHFLTEIMEEYQNIIDKIDTNGYGTAAKSQVDAWKINQYSWAGTYIYGIEKDYRLVKVAKVGCYFYGDGLAQVIYGDGLDSFKKSEDYRGLLKDNAQEPQFSIVISNPPYSVNDCKADLEYIEAHHGFETYKHLTYNSKEIECLFVERTKQLLKDNGVAGIILPSSILSNTGIYTKTREIILQYFDIIAITELGSNTFMATGTNTVILFLQKRNEKRVNEIKNIAYSIAKDYPKTFEDKSVNGIDNPVKKYLDYTEEKEIDPEKFYYFVLNYYQKTLIIKTGQKDAEKRFLGYEYSNRRGHEGMHAVVRSKTIEECTKLFNENDFEDDTKASSYIYRAFNNDFDYPIHESLKDNISCVRLVDMLTLDRPKFEKNISTAVKKKVIIETKWENVKFGEIADIIRGVTYSKNDQTSEKTQNIVLTADNITLDGHFELKKEVFLYDNFVVSEDKQLKKDDVFMCFSSGSKEHLGKVAFIENDTNYLAGGFMGIIRTKENVLPKYLFQLLNSLLRQPIRDLGSGSNINNLSSVINEIKIPLPPKEIQQKIVAEIEVLEKKEAEAKEKIEIEKEKIEKIINNISAPNVKITEIAEQLFAGGDLPKNGNYSLEKTEKFTIPIYANAAEKDGLYGYTDTIKVDKPCLTISARGTIGFTKIRTTPFYPIVRLLVLVPKENIAKLKYLEYAIAKLDLNQFGANIPQLTVPQLSSFEIPLPPLSDQQKIVSEIEKIEQQIAELEQQLSKFPQEKEAVLKRYL